MEYGGPDETDLLGNYVYANGERLVKFGDNPTDVRFYLNDHLGSTVAMVDREGNLRNKYLYLPFGRLHRSLQYDHNQFTYTGQYRDDGIESELMYYGARYYDPELRMFLSVDPQAARYPAWSPYVYTLDNPMKYVDPDGEMAIIRERSRSPDESAVETFVLDFLYYQAYDVPAPGMVAAKPILSPVAKGGRTAVGKFISLMKKGRSAERATLQSENLTKNRKFFTAVDDKTMKAGRTKPDAVLESGATVEIKHVKYQAYTKQLRLQVALSKAAGQKAILIMTQEGSRVSKYAAKAMKVLRRPNPLLDE